MKRSLYEPGENILKRQQTRLLQKYADAQLRIDIARVHGEKIAYLISAVTETSEGEIESIYVDREFRGQAIGDELMRRALGWLDEQKVHNKVIDVAVCNEHVYAFYARFGFFPRVVTLKQKSKRVK